MTIQKLAQMVRLLFVRQNRDNGEAYWSVREVEGERPEWVTDLCRDAHCDMMPDDHKYQFIVEALDAIADMPDGEDPRDLELEVDIYTADLLKWLASNLARTGYCDEAQENGSDGGVVAMIAAGQYLEKREVLHSVIGSLETRLAEVEGDNAGREV